MITYDNYLLLNINTAPLGFEHIDNYLNYFCTPKGAKIIGQTGADGTHFCFIDGFDDIVFVVSPMSTPGNYVHPIANSFSDFLSLLLSIGDAAILEQIHYYDKEQYKTFLTDNPPTEEQIIILNILRNKLYIEPMKNPFEYIKELQSRFDCSQIKFTKEYYEHFPVKPKLPEWKVCFESNCFSTHKSERTVKEVSIEKYFNQRDESWYIPKIYIFNKGLVIDFCAKISSKSINDFINKWDLSIGNDETFFTEEQRIQIESENPLSISITPQISLNKKTISYSHGSSISWNPCFPDCNSLEVKTALNQYNLDPSFGWIIYRYAFPWSTKTRPKITSLSMILKRDLVPIIGPTFHAFNSGDYVDFIHPTTGTAHRLVVHQLENQKLSYESFKNFDYEFPTNYMSMLYSLSPDIAEGGFTVTDCNSSHRPIQKNSGKIESECSISRSCEPSENASSCSIGIIGGSCGPTSVFLGKNNASQEKLNAACSALSFDPVDYVKWKIVFHEKIDKDVMIVLI
jgi:hypothetical protein